MRAQAVFVVLFGATFAIAQPASEIVTFPSGSLTLKGVLFKPEGTGPFPAVVYNHGSAAGMLSQEAFDALGPIFVRHRWVFFGPYRRGQGLSPQAGPYIGDEIDRSRRDGGIPAGAATMVRLLATDHLDDQLAALTWLRKQTFVDGGAESWELAPQLQAAMPRAVQRARMPIFFFQAENDWNLAPTRTLSAAMKARGKAYAVRIYPPYGKSHQDGHTFGYFGSTVWENDVFQFLDLHCGITRPLAEHP